MWFFVFSCLSATAAMAASFALFVVCRSGCDLMFICVMVFVLAPAPSVKFPLTCDPSVYMKSSGFHIFVYVAWFGVFLCWGVFGSAVLGCWCMICFCLCFSRPAG
jgi:hypothetical protein